MRSEADEILWETFGKLCGSTLTDQAWQQATLPIAKGGCGIQSCTKTNPIARLASTLHFIRHGHLTAGGDESLTVKLRRDPTLMNSLCHFPPELEPLKTWKTQQLITQNFDTEQMKQSWWMEKLQTVERSKLPQLGASRDVPRLVLTTTPGAGLWMSAVPNRGLMTSIANTIAYYRYSTGTLAAR